MYIDFRARVFLGKKEGKKIDDSRGLFENVSIS